MIRFDNASAAPVEKQHRGFAAMDQSKQRVIASKGGKTAHERGTAHKWTVEEAREAGRKGGRAVHRPSSIIPSEDTDGGFDQTPTA
jgi:general stress protein YciG